MEIRHNDNSIDLYDSDFLIKEFINNGYAKIEANPEIAQSFSFGRLADHLINQEGVNSVTVHKPESQIEIPKGKIVRLNNQPGEIIEQSKRKYLVQANGSWKRII